MDFVYLTVYCAGVFVFVCVYHSILCVYLCMCVSRSILCVCSCVCVCISQYTVRVCTFQLAVVNLLLGKKE